MDLGIEVILDMFSKKGLIEIFSPFIHHPTPNSQRIYSLKDDYIKTIDAIIAFLQGKIHR